MAAPAVTPPAVRINTFIKTNPKQIDNISKVFILIGYFLGLNRVPVLGNIRPFLTRIACTVNVLYNLYFISLFSNKGYIKYYRIDTANQIKVSQTLFCCVIGFLFWKRLRAFYDELAIFDSRMPHKSQRCSEPIVIALQMIIVLGTVVFNLVHKGNYVLMPVYLMHIIEYNYYGCLFHLLIQRLRLINKCLESSNSKKINGKVMHVSMEKLIDFYHVIIKAYYLLVEAIKWQFIISLIISFMYLLVKSYNIAQVYMNANKTFKDSVHDIILVLTEMVPLLAPCMCCDMIRSEVRRLRELLASKLYENQLDKSSRSIARALLSLTETRNLSFSLLRMVDISISLPFTLMGLLVTYLIILLQFQKVISPNAHNA